MASNKMLIDASHPEETRVAVVRGNRVEEFDYESQERAQIRGNIYLAKVTRVEPSLQAAFVDYGGNRHGFLAFSEIHPDYYQIPYADRQALLEEEKAESRAAAESQEEADDARIEKQARKDADSEEDEEANSGKKGGRGRKGSSSRGRKKSTRSKTDTSDDNESEDSASSEENETSSDDDVKSDKAESVEAETGEAAEENAEPAPKKRRSTRRKPAAKKTADKTESEAPAQADDETSNKDDSDAKADASEETAIEAKPTEGETEVAATESENASDEAAVDESDDTPKTMSAANEGDKISEPAPPVEDSGEAETNDIDGEAEPEAKAGEAESNDDEAAETAEAKPKRRTTRRTSRKAKAEATSESEESTAQESATKASDTADDSVSEAQSGESPAADNNDAEAATDTTEEKDDSAVEAVGESEAEADDHEEAEDGSDENAKSGNKRRGRRGPRRSRRRSKASSDADTDSDDNDDDEESAPVESVGQDDALEEASIRRKPRREYKIQEVIKRRQILLVQVVKEERGNKGAALTTYLSLAGRYSVLMPNTARGGGISRKITNVTDRKRLKAIATELDVPEGMGIILRTAGATRTKADINRDFDYLMRLWENVRSLTLSSSAPCLVYEEGSLIKRSIRDLYNRDIDEVIVSGADGYREAKDFMRMLMPSHAKHVKQYHDGMPIFSRFGVEGQLDKMLGQQVSLKSGGYLVINQTEALVAIDVNSGRATREHSIEETALATNLEAAEEVARQLRLRDLAGLIVIDFIDMEENRNNRAVEKKLKESLKQDRARIQVGRISHFGLLEMSRQRMRASVHDSTMEACPHCSGTGIIRSDSGVALHMVRAIEEHLMRHSRHEVIVKTNPHIALQVLNTKREALVELENRYGTRILFEDSGAQFGQEFSIERGGPSKGEPKTTAIQFDTLDVDEDGDDGVSAWDEDEAAANASSSNTAATDNEDEDGGNSRRRKRKRRRRGKRGRDTDGDTNSQEASEKSAQNADDGKDGNDSPSSDAAGETGDDENSGRNRRRRGKRGGRKNRELTEADASEENSESVAAAGGNDDKQSDGDKAASANADQSRAAETVASSANGSETVSEPAAQVSNGTADSTTEDRPAKGRNTRRRASSSSSENSEETEVKVVSDVPDGESEKPKKGWWNRGFFS